MLELASLNQLRCRAWSASLAFNHNHRLLDVLNAAYWKSESTFINHYLRHVTRLRQDGCKGIASAVVAQQRISRRWASRMGESLFLSNEPYLPQGLSLLLIVRFCNRYDMVQSAILKAIFFLLKLRLISQTYHVIPQISHPSFPSEAATAQAH